MACLKFGLAVASKITLTHSACTHKDLTLVNPQVLDLSVCHSVLTESLKQGLEQSEACFLGYCFRFIVGVLD